MSPYGVAFDHRRVQTAVIGHANSDHPVILPMDARELDLWRKAHPSYTYWCGIQLGGCGGALSDKRYTDKVCHFAHHPSAPLCHRTANGESSADHLFIKRGVQRLLTKQKVSGEVQTRNLGAGPGDAVDVHLPRTRRRLRFQLADLDHRAWRRAVDELADDADDLDWVFGPDTPVTRDLAGRHGFCLRVRCETVGGERRVHIGAERQDRTIQWTPLDECVLTPNGLSTPHVETIRLTRPRPKPPSFPILGGLVFALVPEADVPTSSPFAADDRHLVMADVKPTDSPIVRALLSLPGDTELPPAEHVYRIPDSARLLVTEGGGWAIQANRYVRLNAHEAQRTGLWTLPLGTDPAGSPASSPTTKLQETRPPSGLDPSMKPAVTAPPTESKPQKTSPTPPRTHADLVTRLRDTLAESAQRGSTTTWDALARQMEVSLSALSVPDRYALLAEVDTPLSDHKPVLSALIRHLGGRPLPYLGDVLARLGVSHAKGSRDLRQWAEVEAQRAFAAYGQPAQVMPPRHDLTPLQRLEQSPKSRRTPTTLPPPFKRSDAHLSWLIEEVNDLRPTLNKATRKRANKAITGAKAWLGDLPRDAPKRVRAARASREFHVQSLEAVLRSAHRPADRPQKTLIQEVPQQQESQHTTSQPAGDRPPVSAAPGTHRPSATERLTRELIRVAEQGRTISLLDIEGGLTLPDVTLCNQLIAVDRRISPEAPLLSALVTDADGGPWPLFRRILQEVGLAVPRTHEALLKIWRREQERAHATYADPPRPLPPRLVPRAETGQQADESPA